MNGAGTGAEARVLHHAGLKRVLHWPSQKQQTGYMFQPNGPAIDPPSASTAPQGDTTSEWP